MNDALKDLAACPVSWVEASPTKIVVRPPAPKYSTWLGSFAALGVLAAIPGLGAMVSFCLLVLAFVVSPSGAVQWGAERGLETLLALWWMPAGLVVAGLSVWAQDRWLTPVVLEVREHELLVSGVRGVSHLLPLSELTSVTPTANGWSINRVRGSSIRFPTSAAPEESRLVFGHVLHLAESARKRPRPSMLADGWQDLADRQLAWMEVATDEVTFRPAPRWSHELWKVTLVVMATIVALLSALALIAMLGELVMGGRLPSSAAFLTGALAAFRVYGFLFLMEVVRRRVSAPSILRVRAHELEVERRGRTTRMALRDLATIERSRGGWQLTSHDGERIHVATSDHSENATSLFRWLRGVAEQARLHGTREDVPTTIDALQGRTRNPGLAAGGTESPG